MPDEKQIDNDQAEKLEPEDGGSDAFQDAYDDYELVRDLIKKLSDSESKPSENKKKSKSTESNEQNKQGDGKDSEQRNQQSKQTEQQPDQNTSKQGEQSAKESEDANETFQKRPSGQNPESSEGVVSETKAGQEGAERSASVAKQGLGQASKAGEKNVAGNLAGQGAKAGAKQVGKEAVKEGALAASRAASVAAAPESLGASLAAQAGIEIASRSAGFVKKNFWLILTFAVAFAFLVGGGFAYTYIAKFFFFNSLGNEEKKVLSQMRKDLKDERLKFQNDEDIQKIENGVGSFVATSLINELSDKHEKIKINYLGSVDSSEGNEPYEFDVLGADIIKCTNSANFSKAGEFFVDFNQSAWRQELKNLGPSIICAIDYYPKIEQVKKTPLADHYQIREFSADRLDEFSSKIIAYKQAQIIDEVADIAIKGKGEKNDLLVPPDVIRISEEVANGLPTELVEKIKSAKSKSSFNIATFPKGASNTAMHISYLE